MESKPTSDRTDLSLLGTGLLGGPIAERLVACGHNVTVHNRTAAKAQSALAAGAAWAESASEALDASPVTLLTLRDGPVSRTVLSSCRERVAGKTVVQLGTPGPEESLALAEQIHSWGGSYLEAPVLGSRPQAAAGSLQLLLAGKPTLRECWTPLLSDLGEVTQIGELPSASWIKLALNQIIASHITGFSLSLGLIRRSGAPLERFLEVLRASGIYAPSFDSKLPRLLERSFENPNFPAELMLKDLELVGAACKQLGLADDSIAAFRELYRRTLDLGHADSDYSSVYQAIDVESPASEGPASGAPESESPES